ncbi:MAG: Arm DNA-binding domain-containing protein [Epsilonproteobacteria bacterium]|nr:Arm DNA-binding domain-containing protein [Campylobacterota bacterium]
MKEVQSVLTEADIQNAQPHDSNRKLYDENGLYLLIKTTGGKLWRLKYEYAGVEQSVTFGTYPALSLTQAREICNQHHVDISLGIDPSLKRKALKQRKE